MNDEGPTAPAASARPAPPRSEARRFAALLIVTAATAIAAGHTLRQPSFMTANDISRWCTVWGLLERGTFVIDECPWHTQTQDKIERRLKGEPEDAPKHFYSSKPALIATLIAATLYPARRLSGVPLDRVVLQERSERWTQKPDPDHPGKFTAVLEKPEKPKEWPAYGFYFKPALLLWNVVPFALFLVFFARLLDRYAANEWAWFFSLVAAAFGTYLFPYLQTLNNHTIGAFCAFFAVYHYLRISDDEAPAAAWRFAASGFFSGCAAAAELPALALPALLGPLLLLRDPRRALLFFLPAAVLPLVALVGAQYVEFGEIYLPYESFGSDEYRFEGSLWKTPLEFDALNVHPEPKSVYLFHMVLGHHGVLSLTPLFFFSIWGAVRLFLARRGQGNGPMRAVAALTIVLSVVIVAFYAWNPKARNYGGSAQGLRWVMWLIPLWLLMLPRGVEAGQSRRWARALALLALAVSALSVGYAIRSPWSHPWILDAMEQLGLYTLKR